MTKVYIVVSAFQGCISEVNAYLDRGDAVKELVRVRRELKISPTHQEESQHSAEIKEVELH
jgi:hypothetical protein